MSRQELLDGLSQGSTSEEGIAEKDLILVTTGLFIVHREHTRRMLEDSWWCSAYARTAEAIASHSAVPSSSSATRRRRRRVLVIGLGSAVPALAAARAGSDVVWAERVARFAHLAVEA